MGYMWEGRFQKKILDEVKEFTYSLNIDKKLALYDIKGSTAHAKMLNKAGIIKQKETSLLLDALKKIEDEIRGGKFKFKESDEDIHTAIERRLIEIAGETGKKIHTARSRNDQIVLDEKLFLKDILNDIKENLRNVQKSLLAVGKKVFPSILPGYTHLQHSQPVLLSHYFLAYVEMLERDRERFQDSYKRVDVLPAGVCACCGTSFPIDRKYLAEELGFSKISSNSIDTVSDRDFILEIGSFCGILMVHLSRLAEDLILWNTAEFKFAELPDEFCTGSSIMPQKKNPDVLELIRGKTATVLGNINGLFILMKGLPLSYNRDLQEDKKPLFEILEIVFSSLKILAVLLPKIKFNFKKMEESAFSDFTLATDLAEYLVMKKGVAFRESHKICGELVRYCIKQNKNFDSLSMEEFKKFSPEFSKDVYSILNVKVSVEAKKSQGGTSPLLVGKELKRWEKILK